MNTPTTPAAECRQCEPYRDACGELVLPLCRCKMAAAAAAAAPAPDAQPVARVVGYLTPRGALYGSKVEVRSKGCEPVYVLRGAAPVALQAADPMDWPLPCDVTVGHGTMRKGVALRTLVARMKALYETATGENADAIAAAHPQQPPAPIDMVPHCPACGMQHVDAPEVEGPGLFNDRLAAAIQGRWTNPPHRSHLCHGCGHVWRPADVATNGVAAVQTKGKADSPVAHPQQPPQDSELRRAVREMARLLGGHEWAEHLSADPDAQALESQITAMLPAPRAPVAAQCRIFPSEVWGGCSVEHAQMVLSNPGEWPNYQVRLLYEGPAAHPQQPAT